MSIFLMDDRLHPSGGTGRAVLRTFRSVPLELEVKLGCYCIERSAPQVKRSSSEALVALFNYIICRGTFFSNKVIMN